MSLTISANHNKNTFLVKLPNDLRDLIFSCFLTIKEVLSLKSTCRSLKDICSDWTERKIEQILTHFSALPLKSISILSFRDAVRDLRQLQPLKLKAFIVDDLAGQIKAKHKNEEFEAINQFYSQRKLGDPEIVKFVTVLKAQWQQGQQKMLDELPIRLIKAQEAKESAEKEYSEALKVYTNAIKINVNVDKTEIIWQEKKKAFAAAEKEYNLIKMIHDRQELLQITNSKMEQESETSPQWYERAIKKIQAFYKVLSTYSLAKVNDIDSIINLTLLNPPQENLKPKWQ